MGKVVKNVNLATCNPERYRPRTCTAHFADVATSGDHYADCTKVRENMQEIFDFIVDFYEKEKNREEES